MSAARAQLELAALKALVGSSFSDPVAFVATCDDDELVEVLETLAFARGHAAASTEQTS